jgi:hypothetical protein
LRTLTIILAGALISVSGAAVSAQSRGHTYLRGALADPNTGTAHVKPQPPGPTFIPRPKPPVVVGGGGSGGSESGGIQDSNSNGVEDGRDADNAGADGGGPAGDTSGGW